MLDAHDSFGLTQEIMSVGHRVLFPAATAKAGHNFYLFFIFWGVFFSYCIQHCFICRPSDSSVPTDAGIEPRAVATGALAVRLCNH
jgi:hypothetical protein